MPKWDSTEAPVTTTLDEGAEGYTGHHEDRPVKVSVDGDAENTAYSGGRMAPDVQVAMSPAEAYHFADDLQAAADSCWGAVEYLVSVVHSEDAREGPLETILTTIKAPSPEAAVRRAKSLVEETAKRDDAATHRVRAGLAEDSDTFRVYRADSMTAVRTDGDDDSDN